MRLSATQNLDAAEVLALVTHRTADGKDHADVVTNTSHATGSGADHADVATNSSHVSGDGSDHADVATNTAHSTGSGADHADVATNTADISGGKGPGVFVVEVAGVLTGGPTTVHAFHAPAAGTITAVYSKLDTTCAAAETVDVDVQIATVSCLTAATQHDNADGTNTLTGSIDGAADDFTAGQLIDVVWTEATTGGNTAADLTVTIAFRLT